MHPIHAHQIADLRMEEARREAEQWRLTRSLRPRRRFRPRLRRGGSANRLWRLVRPA